MSRLDSLGLLLKDIYPCKLVLFFPSFADIKPPFNLQAGFDIRCIHLFNILYGYVQNVYPYLYSHCLPDVARSVIKLGWLGLNTQGQ